MKELIQNTFDKPARHIKEMGVQYASNWKMPKIDTLDALEEHEEHEDDYQTNSNW